MSSESFGPVRRVVVALALVFLCPTLVLADYKSSFSLGVQAVEEGRWSEAVEHLEAAIAERREAGGRVRMPGNRFLPYLPHYYLGQAYRGIGQDLPAILALEESRKQGVIRERKKDAEALDEMIGEIEFDIEGPLRDRARSEIAVAERKREEVRRILLTDGVAGAMERDDGLADDWRDLQLAPERLAGELRAQATDWRGFISIAELAVELEKDLGTLLATLVEAGQRETLIGQILQQVQQAIEAENPDGAAQLLAQIDGDLPEVEIARLEIADLRKDLAVEGRQREIDVLARDAETRVRRAEAESSPSAAGVEAARSAVEALSSADRNHPQLPPLRGRLARLDRQIEAGVTAEKIQRARRDIETALGKRSAAEAERLLQIAERELGARNFTGERQRLKQLQQELVQGQRVRTVVASIERDIRSARTVEALDDIAQIDLSRAQQEGVGRSEISRLRGDLENKRLELIARGDEEATLKLIDQALDEGDLELARTRLSKADPKWLAGSDFRDRERRLGRLERNVRERDAAIEKAAGEIEALIGEARDALDAEPANLTEAEALIADATDRLGKADGEFPDEPFLAETRALLETVRSKLTDVKDGLVVEETLIRARDAIKTAESSRAKAEASQTEADRQQAKIDQAAASRRIADLEAAAPDHPELAELEGRLADNKPPIEIPWMWVWIVVGLVLVAAALVVYRRLPKRPKRVRPPEPPRRQPERGIELPTFDPAPAPVRSTAAPPAPEPSETASQPPPSGQLTIDAWPWANITSVIDPRGMNILEQTEITPFVMALPPGRYTVHLARDNGETRAESVYLGAGDSIQVVTAFDDVSPALYLQEAGWTVSASSSPDPR